ncbi:hypothetical protein ACVW0A_004017 [Pseudomonas sp. TE3610]
MRASAAWRQRLQDDLGFLSHDFQQRLGRSAGLAAFQHQCMIDPQTSEVAMFWYLMF